MSSHSNNDLVPGFGFARARHKAFAAVRTLWSKRLKEGWSQADLAERLGRDPAWVSRKLSGPTNWTLRSLGELADAMDGELKISISDLGESDGHRSNFDAYKIWQSDSIDSGRISSSKPRTSSVGSNSRHLVAEF